MKAEYGTVISDAIKTAIANYRGGIVCANMTDQLFLMVDKNIADSVIAWYKMHRKLYLYLGPLSGTNTSHVIPSPDRAYEFLFKERYDLYKHYKILRKIKAKVKLPDNWRCAKIMNGYGGIYTIACYDLEHPQYDALYVYTPICWLPVCKSSTFDPWLLLKQQYNIHVPGTIKQRTWSPKIAAQIVQNVLNSF